MRTTRFRHRDKLALGITAFSLLILGAVTSAEALTRVVARSESAPPGGMGAAEYKVIRRPAVADTAGEPNVAIRTKVRGETFVSRGVYAEGATAGTLVVEDRSEITTMINMETEFIRLKGSTREAVSINAAGTVVYGSTATGGYEGVFQNGGSQLVALSGDSVAGEVLEDFGKPRIVDSGEICFSATAEDDSAYILCCSEPGNDCSDESGSGPLDILVEIGDSVSGGMFQICELPERIGASNYGVVFIAEVGLGGCGGSKQRGVFRNEFGSMTIDTIAQEGLLSGVGGLLYEDFESVPKMNGSGVVTFVAELNDGSTDAVFACDGPCIGVTDEVVVTKSEEVATDIFLTNFNAPDIDDSGNVVFQTRIENENAAHKRARGIYRWNSVGDDFTPIVTKGDSTGDMIEGVTGEFKRIFFPDISPNGVIAFRGKAKYKRNLTVVFTEP